MPSIVGFQVLPPSVLTSHTYPTVTSEVTTNWKVAGAGAVTVCGWGWPLGATTGGYVSEGSNVTSAKTRSCSAIPAVTVLWDTVMNPLFSMKTRGYRIFDISVIEVCCDGAVRSE